MALNNPTDLFLYELSATYDAENKITQMRGQIAGQVRDESLSQELRNEQAKGQQKIENLDGCFQAMGASRQDVPCLAVDGMAAEFQQFMRQEPSPEVLDMFTVGGELKISNFQSATYKGLVDKATLMGQTECAQFLQTNLVQVDEAAGCFERLGHEISQRALAPA
jgi:ferritin-like metal-binding protein YciE